MTTLGVGDHDQIFFVRDHRLLAQRLDVAGAKLVGDPLLVAEDVAKTGPTAAIVGLAAKATSSTGLVRGMSGSSRGFAGMALPSARSFRPPDT